MALELTADISATATVLTVTGTLPTDLAYGYEFRIGDELLTFERYEPDRTLMAGQSAEVPFAPIPSLFVWQVRRGQGGSTAAPHLAAASLVGVNEANVSGVTTAKPIPWPSGGGGGAVDSVNTQTGVVVLDADDVGAVPLDAPDGFIIVGPAGSQWVLFADGSSTFTSPAGSQFVLNADGSSSFEAPGNVGSFSMGADGHARMAGPNSGYVDVAADGTVSLHNALGPLLILTPDGLIKIDTLATTDPAVEDALWSSEGVLMVSAG